MSYLYSQSTGGFYLASEHGENMPEDATPISDEERLTILQAPKERIPRSVTMYQARSILIEDDLIDEVETFLQTMPEGKEKRKALAAWEYAATVDRDSPFTQALASAGALNLSDSQLDDLFVRASKVQ